MANVANEMQFKVNVVRSPEDKRDWRAENIYKVKSVPKIYSCVSKLQPVRDQGLQGTCAAQTAACMKEWQERKDVDFKNYMSPQFVYNNRENQDSEGMYGRDVMNILHHKGICPEKEYKYGLIESPDKIDKKLYETAKNYVISNYAAR